MSATGNTSTRFLNLNEFVLESHIFPSAKTIDGEFLPCIHMLCKSCIGTISSRSGKEPEDKMVCRECKLEFEIPYVEALHERKPMEDLLLEFSKAANNAKPLCEKDSCRWNELIISLASTHCTQCNMHTCLLCTEKHHLNHHHSIKKRSHSTENPANVNHKWHIKQLEVFCVLCRRSDCFMCLVDNLPNEITKYLDTILANEIKSLNELAEGFRTIKTTLEDQLQLESWKKKKEEQIKAKYMGLTTKVQSQMDQIIKQLKTIRTQETEEIEQRMGKRSAAFQSSMFEHETQIQSSYEGLIGAIESHKNSLLDEIRPVDFKVNDESEKKKTLIDTILKRLDRYAKSCASMKSIGKREEKFCAVGAIMIVKRVEELKRELDSFQTGQLTSNEPADVHGSYKTEVTWKVQGQSANHSTTNVESKRRKEEEPMDETVRNLPLSGFLDSSSMQRDSTGRSANAAATFEHHTSGPTCSQSSEYRVMSLSEAIGKYREMLEKIRNQIIPNKIRKKEQRSSPVLKKVEADKFREQFINVKCNRSNKLETAQWRNIEQSHDWLVKILCTEAEGQRFEKILIQMNDSIDDLLKKLDDWANKKHQQGLANFGNTCYFNSVVQCLCQTFLLLNGLSHRKHMSEPQPLIEAFLRFWNFRCIGEPERSKAFDMFFRQLYESSPKFNNFRQHDSHDLFIHFLNDLRTEERLNATKWSQSTIDPRKVLTTVDKVFGGHFITAYFCLKCSEPYYVCECLLDISLPICIPQQEQQQQRLSYTGRESGEANRMSGQQNRVSTADKFNSYSDKEKELERLIPKALNEEQRIPTHDGGRYQTTRQVALTDCLRSYTATEHIPDGYLCLSCQDRNQSAATVNPLTMPAAKKRTLIYNPPAVLVLHMKRFERTTTGFKKRSDRVSYKELLDLGPYCSSDCLRIDPKYKNVWYSLYGVVVHSGSLDSGHYTAYVKVGDPKETSSEIFLQDEFLDRDGVTTEQRSKLTYNRESKMVDDRRKEWKPKGAIGERWMYVSDSHAREVPLHEVLDQEAFMLFYERVSKCDQ